MSRISEFLENPTVSRITRQEKDQYRKSHISVIDLLERVVVLEQQTAEYKKTTLVLKKAVSAYRQEIKGLQSKCSDLDQQINNKTEPDLALKKEITANKNEINKLKFKCAELEKRIQKYETNNQFISEIEQYKTVLIEEPKKTAKRGEIIKFGRYEGKDIEWQVLDINKRDNSVLLISKYLLFEKGYYDKKERCTWETSTIRNYLNNEFYRVAFNKEEKRKIKEELLKNPDNRKHGTKGGNDTRDKVFLLSIDEAKKYFKTDEERVAAFIDEVILIGEEVGWFYWLRSPGYDAGGVACVSHDGDVSEDGISVDSEDIGIRPAIWVNL